MPYPRIDPNHPLTEAARYINAYADEQGLEATLEWLDMGATVGEIAYLAEQRSLRAMFGARGENLNPTTFEVMPLTPEEQAMLGILTAAYMDGLAIGWKGRELKGQAEQGG